MRQITKKDLDWVLNASFGRHTDPEQTVKKQCTLRQIAKVLLGTWEAGNPTKKGGGG